MMSSVSRITDALSMIDGWGPGAAAAVFDTEGSVVTRGDVTSPAPVASITKLVTALTILVAVEEGSIDLGTPLGPPGSTVRHLLCHAGGLPFEGDDAIAAAGTRRIYSNTGYRLLADHLVRSTGMAFDVYAAEAVIGPVGMTGARLDGGADAGLVACVEGLVRLGVELLAPTVIHTSTWTEATTPQIPELAGVVPGWGHYDPCPWGLGPEIRGTKAPHWTGTEAPSEVFGHFGAAGTFLWVDPTIGVGCAVIAGRAFDSWAVDAWPVFSDKVRAAVGRTVISSGRVSG